MQSTLAPRSSTVVKPSRWFGIDRGDRRPVDAVDGLQHVARDGHQRAGVAGRDAGLRERRPIGVRLDLAHGDAQRRVLLAAQRGLDRVGHLDHFARLDARAARPAGGARERIGAADQDELGVGMRVEEGPARRQRDGRGRGRRPSGRRRGGSGAVRGVGAPWKRSAIRRGPGRRAVLTPRARKRRGVRLRLWSSGPCGRGRNRSG